MHPNVLRVTAALSAVGADGAASGVVVLPEPAPTAATAAAQLG